MHGAASAIFVADPVLRSEHLDRAGDPEAAAAYLAAAKAQANLFRQDQAIASAARGLLLATKATDTFKLATSGEALLERGAVGHNHFWFRRYAIERALLFEDWKEVTRQADALLARASEEPPAYATIVAERGRCLARRGRGEATDIDEEKLRLLAATADEAGLRIEALSRALRRI